MISFIIFRFVIRRHVCPNVPSPPVIQESNRGLSAKYPYLTAWLGLIVLNLIPNFFLDWLTALIPGIIVSFVIGLILQLTVGYFLFKFVVQRYVLRYVKFDDTSAPPQQG